MFFAILSESPHSGSLSLGARRRNSSFLSPSLPLGSQKYYTDFENNFSPGLNLLTHLTRKLDNAVQVPRIVCPGLFWWMRENSRHKATTDPYPEISVGGLPWQKLGTSCSSQVRFCWYYGWKTEREHANYRNTFRTWMGITIRYKFLDRTYLNYQKSQTTEANEPKVNEFGIWKPGELKTPVECVQNATWSAGPGDLGKP